LIDAPQEKIRHAEWLTHVPVQDTHDWYEPNFGQLKKKMRFAFENRDKVKEKGTLARKDVENLDWNKIVLQVVQAVKNVANKSNPLEKLLVKKDNRMIKYGDKR